MFEVLVEFKSRYNHCNVPQKDSEYRSLGLWVSAQRQRLKKGKLSTERINQLNDIGFKW